MSAHLVSLSYNWRFRENREGYPVLADYRGPLILLTAVHFERLRFKRRRVNRRWQRRWDEKTNFVTFPSVPAQKKQGRIMLFCISVEQVTNQHRSRWYDCVSALISVVWTDLLWQMKKTREKNGQTEKQRVTSFDGVMFMYYTAVGNLQLCGWILSGENAATFLICSRRVIQFFGNLTAQSAAVHFGGRRTVRWN